MQNKLLSIVIPVFNIKQYITKCIESFEKVNEKYYSLFELIIVNDGSTDSSLQVIEEMLEGSSLTVRIISKENGGHGSTINVGITEAKGKYFKVIDGDDWINIGEFEQFLEKIAHVDVDMIITDYSEQHIYNNEVLPISFKGKIQENVVLTGLPAKRIPMHSLTYRTSILKNNNIQISEKTFYVDTEYTLLPLKYVDNYIYFALDLYQYFLGRPDQSMNINVMKQKSDHHLRVTKRVLDFYLETFEENQIKQIVRESLDYLVNKQIQLLIMNMQVDEIYELLSYADKRNYQWRYDKSKKTISLVAINYKLSRLLDFILNPLLRKQQKEWSESSAY